jgi:hypothetical protein
MDQGLLQLAYISTRHPGMDDGEVERILSVSRLNNRRDGITGFLLFNGQRFLQMLEGPAPAVEQCYARIVRDSRHRALVQLGSKTAAARVFARWAMACQRTDSHAPDRRPFHRLCPADRQPGRLSRAAGRRVALRAGRSVSHVLAKSFHN